jgi:hypothetical protein
VVVLEEEIMLDNIHIFMLLMQRLEDQVVVEQQAVVEVV